MRVLAGAPFIGDRDTSLALGGGSFGSRYGLGTQVDSGVSRCGLGSVDHGRLGEGLSEGLDCPEEGFSKDGESFNLIGLGE